MKNKTFKISEETKLLNFLKENLPKLSNQKIKSLIKYSMVEVDGKITTKADYPMQKGNTVTVYFSKKEIPKYDLKIIYEDEDLIAIDKPSGLLSISNDKEKDITAFRIVSDYIKTENKKNRLFVVHRIDQNTSGVLLFAKNQKIKEAFQKDWNSLVKKREYAAVVEGKMPSDGTIESYLTMDHFQRVHSTKNKEIGWYAKTEYKNMASEGKYTLLKVDIYTGRRNQIRVHLSEQGHPIVGDKKYGSKIDPIGRLALHATKLHIEDVRTGKILKLETPIPDEISSLVDYKDELK